MINLMQIFLNLDETGLVGGFDYWSSKLFFFQYGLDYIKFYTKSYL